MKVFAHDPSIGLFTNLEDAKKKNIDAENAPLYSILHDLESLTSSDGFFHFKLCYPDLTQFPFPCNEWIQTSNPVVESTITGYKALNITWPYRGDLKPFGGLGLSAQPQLNLIDDTPDSPHIFWWNSIGSFSNYPQGSSTVPGPNAQFLTGKRELYLKV